MNPIDLHHQPRTMYELCRLAVNAGAIVTPTVMVYDAAADDISIVDILPERGEVPDRVAELASAVYLEGLTTWRWFFLTDAWARVFPLTDTEGIQAWAEGEDTPAQDPQSVEQIIAISYDPGSGQAEAFSVTHGRGDDGQVTWEEPKSMLTANSSLVDSLFQACDWDRISQSAARHYTPEELASAPAGYWLNMLPTVLGHRMRLTGTLREQIDWEAIQDTLHRDSLGE